MPMSGWGLRNLLFIAHWLATKKHAKKVWVEAANQRFYIAPETCQVTTATLSWAPNKNIWHPGSPSPWHAHQYAASITASRLNIKEETRQRKTKEVGHCGYSSGDKYERARLEKALRAPDPVLSSTVTSCREKRPRARRDTEAWGGKRTVLKLYTKQIFIHTYFRKRVAPRSPSHLLCSVTSIIKSNRLWSVWDKNHHLRYREREKSKGIWCSSANCGYIINSSQCFRGLTKTSQVPPKHWTLLRFFHFIRRKKLWLFGFNGRWVKCCGSR